MTPNYYKVIEGNETIYEGENLKSAEQTFDHAFKQNKKHICLVSEKGMLKERPKSI